MDLSAVTSCKGASSTKTCTLVPVKPNELIPARRGLLFFCQCVGLITISAGILSKLIRGLSA